MQKRLAQEEQMRVLAVEREVQNQALARENEALREKVAPHHRPLPYPLHRLFLPASLRPRHLPPSALARARRRMPRRAHGRRQVRRLEEELQRVLDHAMRPAAPLRFVRD